MTNTMWLGSSYMTFTDFIKKPNQNAPAFQSFSTIFFPTHQAGNMSVYSVKSRFWTNEELSLMVGWSSSVSISHFKVQSFIGHLVTCNTGGKETNSPKCKLNFALQRKVTGYWSIFLKEYFEPTEFFLLCCRVLKPADQRSDKIYLIVPRGWGESYLGKKEKRFFESFPTPYVVISQVLHILQQSWWRFSYNILTKI